PAATQQPPPSGPAERPDLVSAQLAAHAEKRRIEVTDARTESTSTFVNPDGTITVDSYSGIRRVRRGDGWADVDATLVLADGKVTPKVAKAGITLSAGGKAGGEVATLVDGGRELSFGWPAALPEPTLAGDTATYHDAAPDTDLVVKVVATGYDVRIVARTPAAAQAALRLPMRLKGLTAERTEAGELRLSAGGKVAARSPTPLMWDAHVDPTSKLADRTRGVDSALEGTGAAPTLALKPDKGWLTDAARQYPVTIDPAATLADNLDTDVNDANPTTNYDTNDILRVGNYLGATVNRSFLRFDDSAIKNRHVTSAVLNLWQDGSATCTGEPTIVQGAGGMGPGTTWNTQPSSDGITWGSGTFNNGGSCTGSGGTNIDITGLVDAWAHNGSPSPEALTIRAPSESDANQFKYFYSGDTMLAPHISTTYNSYPGTVAGRFTSPCSAQCGGSPATVLTNTTTPTLSGSSRDPDGGQVRVDFEVWNSDGTTKITGGSVANTPSNSPAYWTVPSGLLTNGTSYEWRARAYDGVDYSQAWSSWIPLTVDTTAPAAPSAVSSAAWPSGGWAAATSGTFTWTSPGGDTQSFLYGLDQPSPATEQTATTTPALTAAAGLHTFYVRTKDKAGNLSSIVSYGFGVGAGALAQPADGARVQRFTTLEGQAPSAQTKVTFQYRLGTNNATAWTDVPTGAAVIGGGTTHPSWPMARNGSGLFDKLTWDLAATMTAAGAPDGPVQVQACFQDAANTVSCVPAHTVQYTRHAFADAEATQAVGPGSVALLTGDYSVSATDASMPSYTGDITVGRTFTTLGVNAPAGAGLTVDPSTPAAVGWNGNGCTSAGNAVTASFTAPANALLLALADTASTGSGGSTVPSISDSGGLSWLRIGGSGANGTKDEAVAWWARTSSAAARTVTLTSSTNTCSKFLQVVVVMNANLTTPIGATNIGPPGDTTAGVFNQSVTSTVAGSLAFAAVADWNAAAVPTPGSGVTLQGSYHQSDLTGAALYKTAAASAPGQALTVTTTAPSTATNSWSMFEVLPAGASNTIFGPGWTASMPGPDAGIADETLTDSTDSGGYVTFTDETGVQDVYTRSGTGGYPYTYTGVGDDAVDGSTLTKDSATQFTHTDVDGSKTVFVAQTVGGVTTWHASQVIEPGSNTTSTYTTDAAGRVTRILAPVPAGVSCATLVAGCRALSLTYATSTTATGTGTDPATWGSYTGRVSGMAMALNGAAPVNVAAYAYDSAGRLRSAKDPRTNLTTTYSYDAAGRLAQITPPGQATWSLAYDGSGRIATVSRPTPAGPTATQTIAYDIAVSGGTAPIDLSAGTVAGWAQQDLPLYGAGVFPADHVPPSPPSPQDWPYADLTYLNTDGRQVNGASYGNGAWQITTTEHDAKGNTIRTLSAENRNQALTPTADTDPTVAALTTSAARSQQLDEQTAYTADGVSVADTYGPTHQILDNSGARYSGREHVHTDYDQGAPSSPTPYRLATTVTTAIRLANGSDVDPRKTVNGYEAKTGADASTSGWNLRKPTTVTTWMGGGSTPDIVRTTYYNAAGNVVESRQPKANTAGTDAFTTVTGYYTTTGSGGCVNASWTGLACTSGPAAQPSSGNPLPVSTYTYNDLNEALTEVETVSSTTRTTTTTYDSAGRKTSEAVAASPAANGGSTIPTATYGFDSATGLPTTTTADSVTLTTGYDSWGRVTSQTDADGNSSTTSYDIAGRIATAADGKGTYTYTYDGGSGEHRGLLTSLNVGAGSAPSTFTAGYNADGKMTTQTYPNGLVASTRYDDNGEPTALSYAKDGNPWLAFSEANSVYGQIRSEATPASVKALGYDPSGRLTSVADTVSYGGPASCSTRVYAYDADSNRLSLTSYPDGGGSDAGTCSTSTSPSGYSFAYDQADRLTNSGYAYDLFGRTTTDPYPPAGSSASLGYYVNDLVASETVGSSTRSYALDPARRVRSWTDGSTTTVNHYTSASGDSPGWIGVGTSWSRNITGIGGDLAAVQTDSGAVTLQLANLHGDVVATVDDSTSASSPASYAESTEFGSPYFPSSAYPRYGWLGAKQRSRDTLSGLTLMGVRLYDPSLGRFLQTDPEPGGSDNPYDYAHQDPYNTYDLDGKRFHFRRFITRRNIGVIAVALLGVYGATACVASIVCGVAAGAVVGASAYAVRARKPTSRELYKAAAMGGLTGGAGKAIKRVQERKPRPRGRHRR
ncbi:DNRLRE domain-containing protein, partial [Frankia tisae]